MKEPRIASVNALFSRNSGPFKFIEADIVVRVKNLDKAHFVSQRIAKEIRQQVSHVDHILIHYEPLRKETTTYAVPLNDDKQCLSEHIGDAPCFYLATVREKDGVHLSEGYYHNPFAQGEKGKGIKVSEWLLEKGVDTVYSPKGFKGKGPGYVFSDAGVDVIVTECGKLDDIKNSMIKGHSN